MELLLLDLLSKALGVLLVGGLKELKLVLEAVPDALLYRLCNDLPLVVLLELLLMVMVSSLLLHLSLGCVSNCRSSMLVLQ